MPFAVKNKMSSDQFEISDLASKLQKGSLALFPTDTLPALCAYPKFSKKIWTIKKRPLNKPLILMGGCLDDLFEFVKPCAIEDGLKLAKNYWPGALNGLSKGGWLILEHHYDQSEKITKFMQNIGMDDVAFEKDLSGIKRYAICRKK